MTITTNVNGKIPLGNEAISSSTLQITVPQVMIETIASEHGSDENIIKNIAGQYLQLGFDMSRVAGASATTADLQRVLDNGSDNLLENQKLQIAKVEELTNDLDKLIKETFDAENKSLTETLSQAKDEFVNVTGILTDEDNVNSIPFTVAQKAEEVVTSAIAKSQKALDIAAEGSVAHKLFNMFESKLDDLIEKQVAQRTSLDEQTLAMREALGLQIKMDEVTNKSSGKGKTMEQVIGDKLTVLAGAFGDDVENIGDETDGVGKDKKGDHIVKVHLDNKPIGNIVFEDKAGSFTMSGPKSLPAQMKDAAINYNAQVSVGVVTEEGPKMVTKKAYHKVGTNGHIVVVDWKNQDMTALDILYPILREMVIVNHLTKANVVSTVDSKKLISICEDQLSKLSNFNKLKKNLRQTVALTAQNVANEIDLLQQELKESFSQMLRAVRMEDVS